MESVLSSRSFKRNSGFHDGQNAGSMRNPPHRQWPRDRNNSAKFSHFDAEYLAGYLEGYHAATGVRLQ